MASKGPRGLGEQRRMAGRHGRPAIERALALVEAVAAARQPTALSELAARQRMPIATAHRLCQRLEEEGFIVRHGASRRYSVGARLLRLGLDVVHSSGQSSVRREILTRLVETIGETCNLTTLVGTEVLYLDRVETKWPLRLALEPGSRVPMHCTASGKMLLASLPAAAQRQILGGLELTQCTPNTLTDRDALRADLGRIRQRGYSLNDEEFIVGLVGIAVPIRNRKGTAFAAVACHAPSARLNPRQAVELVPRLREAAIELARSFED